MLGLRIAVLGLAAGAVGGMIAACGSGALGSFAGAGGDGGIQNPDSSSSTDGPTLLGDGAASDARADAPPPGAPGAIFVHASPIEDLRFCWAVSQDGGPPAWSSTDPPYPSGAPMPESNYPGVARGSAVPVPDAASMEGATLTVVGIDANTLAVLDDNSPMGQDCADRLGNGTSAVPKTAIFSFPPLAMTPLPLGSTELLVVSGCAANDPQNASPRLCGATWTASAGNLRIDVVPIPTPAVEGGGGALVAQAIQLSPALAAAAGDASVAVSFGAEGAGDAAVLAQLSGLGGLAPTQPTALAVPGADAEATFQNVGFTVGAPGDAGTGTWMSLAESLALVDPSLVPAQYFALPTSYVVAVVGDPSAPRPFSEGDAMYDGTGLHVLVLEVQ